MLLDSINEKKEEILDIFRGYNITSVRITGSVSRQEETDDSDIDFIVCMPKLPNGSFDLMIYTALKNELNKYFNRKIDIADEEQMKELNYKKALQDSQYLGL